MLGCCWGGLGQAPVQDRVQPDPRVGPRRRVSGEVTVWGGEGAVGGGSAEAPSDPPKCPILPIPHRCLLLWCTHLMHAGSKGMAGGGVSHGAVPVQPCPPANPRLGCQSWRRQPLVQGGLGCGPQHSPKSLEHICSIMPSALCSISHCVQILDTVVRDQPLSQLPAADACHLGELCRNMLGEPWQLFCSLGSCAGVMRGAQNTLLASAPASPPGGDQVWERVPSRCRHFGAQQQRGWPQPDGCHSPDPDPGLPLGDVPSSA